MPYRKRNGRNTWHWCLNCINWPAAEYEERAERPDEEELRRAGEELCAVCANKELFRACQKEPARRWC